MEHLSGHEPYTMLRDSIVEEHIHNIVERITKRLVEEIRPKVVVLSGSLARGEATAYRKDGCINMISDFEIGCVDQLWLKRWRLRKLAPVLAKAHNIDLTLNFFLPRRFSQSVPTNWALVGSPLTIDQYELMKAARFIYGPDPRGDGPDVSSDDIPVWEGIRLLFNRMVELTEAVLLEEPVRGKGSLKACNKMLTASGDALLLSAGRYHHLYRERMRYFQEISLSHTLVCSVLSPTERSSIIQAYHFKLYPQEYDSLYMKNLISESLSVSEKVFRFMVCYDMGLEFSSYKEFFKLYLTNPKLKEYCRTKPILQNIVSLLRVRGQTSPVPLKDFFGPIPAQHKIYAEIPVWLYGCFKPLWDTCGYDSLEEKSTRLRGERLVQSWKRLCG